MTTENTDAATRILTKTISKLTEQLAEADESIRHQEGKRKGTEDELRSVRAKLAGTSKPDEREVRRGADFMEWLATPVKAVGQLADERMAELAEERKNLQLVAEESADHRRRVCELDARIEKALASLEGTGSAVARVHAARRALRGEA